VYAVIRAGGKQYKVAPGDVIEVERIKDSDDSVEFTPLFLVDDKGKSRSSKSELKDARVLAKVLGETKGDKVDVFKYRNKTGYRRSTGHRQKYTSVQISEIKLTAGRSSKSTTSRTSKTKEENNDGA
jgi:large subunit ribosomal protein L21